jgi:hypothetical protein
VKTFERPAAALYVASAPAAALTVQVPAATKCTFVPSTMVQIASLVDA